MSKVTGTRWFWFALGVGSAAAVATSATVLPENKPEQPPPIQVCKECDHVDPGCPCCICIPADFCEYDERMESR